MHSPPSLPGQKGPEGVSISLWSGGDMEAGLRGLKAPYPHAGQCHPSYKADLPTKSHLSSSSQDPVVTGTSTGQFKTDFRHLL